MAENARGEIFFREERGRRLTGLLQQSGHLHRSISKADFHAEAEWLLHRQGEQDDDVQDLVQSHRIHTIQCFKLANW